MKGWRPEGWEKPNEEYHDICDIPTVQDAEYDAFEAGADAIVKALCTDKNRLDCIDQFSKKRPIHKWGWLVYITDRKEEG